MTLREWFNLGKSAVNDLTAAKELDFLRASDQLEGGCRRRGRYPLPEVPEAIVDRTTIPAPSRRYERLVLAKLSNLP